MTKNEFDLHNLIDEALITQNAPIAIARCFMKCSYTETYNIEPEDKTQPQFSLNKTRFDGTKYEYTIFQNSVKQDVSQKFAESIFCTVEKLYKKNTPKAVSYITPNTTLSCKGPFNRFLDFVFGQNTK